MIINDSKANSFYYSSLFEHSRPGSKQTKEASATRYFFISLCAIICGADNWVAIEEFGLAKEDWFTELLGLGHGIPSHDTFGEVYAAIDTEQFSDCFSRWVADLASITEGEVIAIDGKCLRRSLDKASKKAAIYMASAWAQQNNLVLGQVKADDKSNETTAIPKLLSRLDIAGAVVTVDTLPKGGHKCDGLPKEDSRTGQAARRRLCVQPERQPRQFA